MSSRALKSWLAWCVLLAVICITSAIFEEQLGEFDWKRENIGIIDSSFTIREQLIVATSDGVLACLNSRTGGATWRVVLPQHSKIAKFVEVDGQLVTLVSQPASSTLGDHVESITVRAWSVVDGSLLWDTFLGTTTSSAESAVDLMYVSSNKQLVALFDNALHVITPPSGQSSPAYWTWSAETDLAAAATTPAVSNGGSSSREGLTLVLSSLIAPTYSPDHTGPSTTNSVTRTAVGCFVRGAASKDAVCEGELVMVKVGTDSGSNGGAVALEMFPLSMMLQDGYRVRVVDVTAVVASDASLPYQANDVLFAPTRSASGENAASQLSLAVLSLEQQQQAAHFSLEAAGAQDTVKSFVFVGADGELRPAVSVCSSSQSSVASSCKSFVANAPANARSPSEWSLQSLLQGVADCDGQDVRLQYGSFPFFDRVVHSLSCASVAVSSATGHLASIAIKSSRAASDNNKGAAIDDVVVDLTPLQVVLPAFSSSSLQSVVNHLAVLPSKPTDSSTCVEHRLLVVLHSGHTLMLSAPCIRSSNNDNRGSVDNGQAEKVVAVLLWERFEGLARAQQAVVMDRALAAADGEDHRMPSFPERLALQRGKLLNLINSGADMLLSAVDSLKTAAQRLTGGKSSAGVAKGRKRRDLDKLQSFGFDKIAAVLCYSDELARRMGPVGTAAHGVPFSRAGLQIAFLDLLRSPGSGSEEVQSLRYLSLPNEGELAEEEVTFVKLLPGVAPTRRLSTSSGSSSSDDNNNDAAAAHDASASKGVLVVLGTASGRTYFWDVSPFTPAAISKVCSADGTCANPLLSQQQQQKVSVEMYSMRSDPVGAPLVVAATGAHSHPAYTILHAPPSAGSGDVAVVTVVHDKHSHVDTSAPIYVHSVDKATGRFTVYKTSPSSADREACSSLGYAPSSSPSSESSVAPSHPHPHLGLSCVAVRATASAFFDPRDERILDVTYPTAQDAVHVPYSILGDDSVLLKYLNPHVALITTVSATTTTVSTSLESGESNAASSADEGNAEADSSNSKTLFWTLVDTVTGKVIIRLHQESADLPVHAILLENHIVATYWNSKAKRTELSSTALYEGVIDNTELTPFASSRARSNSAFLAASAASASSKVRSAYSAVPPIAMQKTYTLPRAVSALHHTVTAHGLSNKNLLVGLRNGQVYSIDMKQVHPRRPFSDPSAAEKTEGLVRYSPFVTLSPLSALTLNYSLPGGVARIVSSASNLESSSLVLSFGGAAVDMHLNRVMPSQDFDLLSSDFNYSLLVTILLALATAVLFLRNLQQRKHLGTIWA